MDYGRITKFDSDRAFGFIAPDRGGPDIFFHVSGLSRSVDPRSVRAGAQVSYEEDHTGPKGAKAVRIRFLASHREDAWPEYAESPQEPPEGGAGTDVYAEAWEAARVAFSAVLREKGLIA